MLQLSDSNCATQVFLQNSVKLLVPTKYGTELWNHSYSTRPMYDASIYDSFIYQFMFLRKSSYKADTKNALVLRSQMAPVKHVEKASYAILLYVDTCCVHFICGNSILFSQHKTIISKRLHQLKVWVPSKWLTTNLHWDRTGSPWP